MPHRHTLARSCLATRPVLTVRDLLQLQASHTIEQQLHALVGASVNSYLKVLCEEIVAGDCSEDANSMLNAILAVAERIEKNTVYRESQVLQRQGVTPALVRAERSTQKRRYALLEMYLINLNNCTMSTVPDVLPPVVVLITNAPVTTTGAILDASTAAVTGAPTVAVTNTSTIRKPRQLLGNRWATEAQEEWLREYFEKHYLSCMPTKNYTHFWPALYQEWEKKWPKRTAHPQLKLKPLHEPLSVEDISIENKAKIECETKLRTKIRWLASGETRSRATNAKKRGGSGS
ncbi:hypothetical protein BV22DRAFT_1052522, partial [Leucogyrophana mollusca]